MPQSHPVTPPGYEKLGLFYLGRKHDLASGRTGDEPVLYESRDLVTHAVCVGMTGSGKTGLCLGILEEAAIDGVPVIAIDPKGDLGNLLLTFPSLSAGDFEPWVDADEARRAGVSREVFAARQAAAWSEGLSAWGQDGARIERLRRSAQFSLFTPGSRAGRPVSILRSFAAPPPAARGDGELLAERAAGTATTILVLAGADAAPRSRDHTLVAAIFSHLWQQGTDLDLPALIRAVQDPPFARLGVLDVESFFPSKERFELAMRLNGVLAAPGFDTWLAGEPLDPQALLYTAAGTPRVSIFSIAHLAETERMFFVALLLNEVVGWMRRQPGTSSLRALLYMDEIHGYFPPVASPPTKPPLLTLLKQGRAAGLGVLLATQNPVDLDYKGLGNTGTWLLGRLQTERDKARVLDGLDAAAAAGMDRAEADRILSALGKRIFLMHDVHLRAPVVFESRWTLSYLRGPLTREQIRALQDGAPAAVPDAAAPPPLPSERPVEPAAPRQAEAAGPRPVLPPGIQEVFLPGEGETYLPALIGAARVGFTDRRLGVDAARDVVYVLPLSADALHVDWAQAEKAPVSLSDLDREPSDARSFAPVPAAATQPRALAAWQKAFARWLALQERLDLVRHPATRLVSAPEETEGEFRARVLHAMHVARDEALDAVRRKYAARQAALAGRRTRAEEAVAREQEQASGQKVQTAVSFGATVLGALFGRKAATVGTLGRATTAARGVGRSMKEASDVKRAQESLAAVEASQARLEEDIAREMALVAERFEGDVPLERLRLPPKRGQVEVQLVALAWIPSGARPAAGAAPSR